MLFENSYLVSSECMFANDSAMHKSDIEMLFVANRNIRLF